MKKISIVVVCVMLCTILIGCGKKEAPKQIKLPTTVIKQTNPQELESQNSEVDSPGSQSNQPAENSQQQEPFNPVVYEQENDDIQNLVDILEELIEQQE